MTVVMVGAFLCAQASADSVAPATEATPEASPDPSAATPSFPDGRVEVTGTMGWVRYGQALGLKDGVMFGGEMTHHFVFPHKRFALGLAVAAEGSFSNVVGRTDGGVDVILASVGTTLGLRTGTRVMPFIGAGGGFVVVDAESSGLDVTARLAFHVKVGVRYYPTNWLVLRAGTKLFIHDNVQYGGGSGQFEDVFHWAFTTGVGIIR